MSHLGSISSRCSRKSSRSLKTLGSSTSSLTRETTLTLTKTWTEGVIFPKVKTGANIEFTVLIQLLYMCCHKTLNIGGRREELTLGPTAPGAPPSPGTPCRKTKRERKVGIIILKISIAIIMIEQLKEDNQSLESFSPGHLVCRPLLGVQKVQVDPTKNKKRN